MTLREALLEATRHLTEAGVSDPRMTAQLLLASLLRKDLTYLLIYRDEDLDAFVLDQYHDWVTQRAGGRPLQYITGLQAFYGLEFAVTPDVLIPRPETELIVEEVMGLNRRSAPLIIDVGTGSGCLAVTLAVQLPESRCFALDISPEAIDVAASNARRHGVKDRVTFMTSDLFAALEDVTPLPQADFIVSNPPYVCNSEFPSLQPEIREHEPPSALLAGPDGLDLIRRLLVEGSKYLRPGGTMIIEIGFGQSRIVTRDVNPEIWNQVKVKRDLRGIERILVLQLMEKG